jgi:cytochrome P450
MPGYSIHANTDIWVPTVSQFDPSRFVNSDTKRGGSDFLAWGAPPHMCPARQFATTEISILVALLAVRLICGRWYEMGRRPGAGVQCCTVLYPRKDHHICGQCQGAVGWEMDAADFGE